MKSVSRWTRPTTPSLQPMLVFAVMALGSLVIGAIALALVITDHRDDPMAGVIAVVGAVSGCAGFAIFGYGALVASRVRRRELKELADER